MPPTAWSGRRTKNNAAALVRYVKDKVPCEFCGRAYAEGNSIQSHRNLCPENPDRFKPQGSPSAPCDCGRRDSHGKPYMKDRQGGPCWKCLREKYPNPDMDALDRLVFSGATKPRRPLSELGERGSK
jgi:hypothetical protein